MSKAQEKTTRVIKALNFEEPDRVPVGEFFWTLFVERWRKEKNFTSEEFIYDYYDLDYLYASPDMSPLIKKREIIEQKGQYTIFKTGFGSTMKKSDEAPMPHFVDFAIKSAAEYKDFKFDDPLDERRYMDVREDIINCGDTIATIPSYMDTLESYKDRFMMVGGVCEPFEYLWRCRGTEGCLLDMAMYPDETKEFVDRIAEFNLAITKKQIELGGLKAMYIWGDVAYTKGRFFSKEMWKNFFYSAVKELCSAIHERGAKVIYHGCGDARDIYEDLIEAGIDCYNPLEAKARLDVVELKKKYHKKLAFCGNIDVRVLADGDKEKIKTEVLRKLNAAKGGGYMIQSDHSVPSNVSAAAYDYMMEIIRSHGDYPLSLGDYDEDLGIDL